LPDTTYRPSFRQQLSEARTLNSDARERFLEFLLLSYQIFTKYAGEPRSEKLGRLDKTAKRLYSAVMTTNRRLQKKPAEGDWSSHYILYRLHEKGMSYERLSRLNGYYKTAAALINHKTWPKMQSIVAKAIGVAPQEIWPSRYNEDGTPKRGLRLTRHNHLARHTPNMAQQPPADNVEVAKAD
jgi:Ner family transcriptional regulator